MGIGIANVFNGLRILNSIGPAGQQLLQDLQGVLAATDYPSRATAIAKMITDSIPVEQALVAQGGLQVALESAPMCSLAEQEQHLKAFGDGHILQLLIQNGPALVQLFMQIFALFPKKP